MNLLDLFRQQQKEYQKNPYPELKERQRVLKLIKKGLQHHAYSLCDAVNGDFSHRATEETLFCEIFTTVRAIDFTLSKLKKWMKKRRRNVSWIFLPAYAYVIPQPVGVVGIMVPWNYPLFLSLVPAINAVAAGNRVMIKMSELSTQTGLALAHLIQQLGLENYICVINGDVEVSKEFASLPFNHLLFTGSTQVGKQVMRAASENLTPVTLELGGKSPAVLSSTMNQNYFNRLFMGKMFNAGQTCIAPDYLLVPSDWEPLIEQKLKQFIDIHYPLLMKNDDYSSIISENHQQRLLDIVSDAQNKGARIVRIGDPDSEGRKLPVYLVFGVTDEMRIMQEELFGPILPVMLYQEFDAAVAYINTKPNPLALYYFGEDQDEISLLERKTLSGALSINETMVHVAIDDLPFGGVGYSGMGHYHGPEGFDTFSKLKPVLVQSKLSAASWLYPPYGAMMRLFLSWIGGIKPRDKQ